MELLTLVLFLVAAGGDAVSVLKALTGVAGIAAALVGAWHGVVGLRSAPLLAGQQERLTVFGTSGTLLVMAGFTVQIIGAALLTHWAASPR